MDFDYQAISKGILVVTADTHTNSRGGIMPPSASLISGNRFAANPVQRFMWRGWKRVWEELAAIKAHYQLPIFTVFNGDTIDRNKHDPWDVVSQNPVDILDLAIKTLTPALDISDGWEFVRGTEAHTGNHSWFEDELAKDLGAEEHSYGYAHYSLLLKFGAQIFDIRHHTESNSIRPWTKGAGAMRSSKIVQDNYHDSNDKPPDWAIRNHVHHFEDSGLNRKPRAPFLPCWQAPAPLATKRIKEAIKLGLVKPESVRRRNIQGIWTRVWGYRWLGQDR